MARSIGTIILSVLLIASLIAIIVWEMGASPDGYIPLKTFISLALGLQ